MKYLNLLILTIFVTLSACAQGEKKTERSFIPRELLMQDANLFDVQLSTNGTTVYFKRRGSSDTIYYRQPQETSLEKFIVFPEPVKSYTPTFNGGLLAVSTKAKSAKVYFAQGAKVKDITPFPVSSAEVLAFSRRLNSKAAIKFGSKDIGQRGVWLIDFGNQKPRKVGLMEEMEKWYFDGLFQVKAGMKTNTKGGVSLFRKENGIWVAINEYLPDVGKYIGGYQGIVSVSEDGNTIYYTDNFEKDKSTLMSIDVQSGETKELGKDELVDLLPSTAIVNAEGKPQMILGVYGDARRVYTDKETEVDMLWLEKELRGSPSIAKQSEDGNIWLVKELTGAPVYYHYFNRKAKKLTRLFSSQSDLDRYKMAERSRFTVRTRDAKKLPVHVYLPAGADGNGDGYPDNPLPTVLFVHGGPWKGVTHWNSWAVTRNFQLLADRGYAVINTEFRGSGGLGKAFTDAGDGQWGAKMRLDLDDIARWAQKEGISEEDKVGIWGYSYGGYAAMSAAALSPGEYACHISMAGVSDLTEYLDDKSGSTLWTTRVGNPNTEEGRATLKKASPINYVKNVEAPVFLVSGGQDTRVPESQSEKFATALDDAGKSALYLSYPEEGHHFSQQNTWISFWAIAEQYLAKHLGGEFAPIGEDAESGFYDALIGADFIDGLK